MDRILLFSDGMVLFFGTWFIQLRFAILIAFVLVAAAIDVRSHRIPNWLVVAGALTGVLYQALSPYDRGVLAALGGLAVGFVALLPLYLMRAMGAGDVKLMAMVGSFLGPIDSFYTVLLTLAAGGVLGIAMALLGGTLGRMLKNVQGMFITTAARMTVGLSPAIEGTEASVGKMPYGVAIAAGTCLHVVLSQRGYALL